MLTHLVGTLVVALSAFTDAARNLLALLDRPARAPVNGTWQAQVRYDWPNAEHLETFSFRGDGNQLYGTASFLTRPRGIRDGEVRGNQLSFVTRSQELRDRDEGSRTAEHRYRGTLDGDRIDFVMLTEGGFTDHVPVSFVARRVR